MSLWYPDAERVEYPNAGSFAQPAPPRIVWHTTEGYSLPRYSGSAPHFTLDPSAGKLWQHIPINKAAMALEHRAGTVHTNHAHAIQVELIGFAKDTDAWPARWYRNVAKLARWIENNAGVKRQSSVDWKVGVARLTPDAWLAYEGHLGHCHVPGNAHWDPGAFRIAEVLGSGAQAADTAKPDPCRWPGGPHLKRGSNGPNVRRLQVRLNTIRNSATQPRLAVDGDYGPATKTRVKQFQSHHALAVDGVVGPRTWRVLCRAVRAR